MILPNYSPSYSSEFGSCYCGDSLDLLNALPDESVQLVMTSPPFALLRKKEYGNKDQHEYIEWLGDFAKLVLKKLKPDGSFVIDMGGAYQKGVPSRSLYNFKTLIYFCEELGFHLAEDFYWYNPSKLPSPIEWVNKRKIRAKDSVNTVWWLSKTEFPKADIKNVLVPYSQRMQKLLEDPDKYYDAKKRPSGHDIGKSFSNDNGGAIPSNLLEIPNSESNSLYISNCKKTGVKSHPARFPSKLPEFFIKFLTEPGDLVIDIFGGSNTTGETCEKLSRKWLSFELEREYVAASIFRFLPKSYSESELNEIYTDIMNNKRIDLNEHNKELNFTNVLFA
jgi:DNA modification methylase